ncbi:hypothetical protein BpHYR1_022713 [Brachionus plicatilis]|uniref:Uncharacterized protein n=1 Tax=Brachionus plicatilis TaxID=10195 RepID=A0A3M7T758_BRAPC|nr:hypothetical protein BpHYR1_022713 [Brachionus plicatilis]
MTSKKKVLIKLFDTQKCRNDKKLTQVLQLIIIIRQVRSPTRGNLTTLKIGSSVCRNCMFVQLRALSSASY